MKFVLPIKQTLDRLLSDDEYRASCEILVDPDLIPRANAPLDRMLAFQAARS